MLDYFRVWPFILSKETQKEDNESKIDDDRSTTATAIDISSRGVAAGEQREVVIGVLCDRTGPTQIIGVTMCPAYHDYMHLVNQRGGVEGYKIKADEIDVEYKVPPAVEAYGRQKAEGAISMILYGTPQTQALTQKLNEDTSLAPRPVSAPQLRPMVRAIHISSPLPQPIGRKAQRQSSSSKKSLAAPLRVRRSLTYSMIIRPVTSPWRFSRSCRSLRSLNLRRLPCRRPELRWARKYSTSPSVSDLTS